ncbi:MAG: glycerate dehydrogenase [Firmicutes bacterium]|nr:glycerate dehydrogenase [Bacillota bacterium]
MRKIVVLDGYVANPGDLSWGPLESLGELIVYDRSAPEEVAARIGDAEIVLTNKVDITAEIMDVCPSLRFIGEMATGYNNIDVVAAKARGILVTNIPAYSTASVAQMVFAFLLEIAQQIVPHSNAVHTGRWTNCEDFCFRDYPLFELEGKTLGIIGYGAIGKRVAKIAVALGMKVLAYSRTYRPELSIEDVKIVTLDELLAYSQVITLHFPQNDDSINFINQETIAQMQDGVILINTARGGCVVERDLREALESGKISWYAADVLSTEPPTEDNPLLGAPNSLITPHIAWMTMEARTRLLQVAYENVKAYIEGSPVHVVNP